jgi:enoyl-[acyl-carrier-protein] reductase (NADH)
VADAAVYLASDAASYVTGTVLHVDGGFSSSGFGFFDGFAIPAPKPKL